jgi:hypothetical protein
MKNMRWLIGVFVVLMIPAFAFAVPYTFVKITNNNVEDLSGQLLVDVTGTATTASFYFTNNVGIASSITDVYFDDGTLLGISAITSSAGVAFDTPATPGDLPGGNDVGFSTTAGFSADSDAPIVENGVNTATEWLQITFNLINGKSIDDTLAALNDGSLRIGMHVQGIGAAGGSDGYVNNGSSTPVPEPGTMMLLGSGLVGLAGWGRKKFRK